MSDNRAKYENLDHNLLYSMVQAGDPDQVDALAAKWNSLKTDMNNLATALNNDLAALAKTWNSPSGDEYHKRVGTVVTFANTIAGDFGSVDSGLKLMSGPLREAKKNAEDPAETADNDSMVGGMVAGASGGGAVAGPFGAVAGGAMGAFFGHERDEEQRKQAHQRMIDVVTTLADEYDTTSTSSWPNDPQKPPGELPGTAGNTINPISDAGTSVRPHTVPATGTGGPAGQTDLTTRTPHEAPIAPAFDPDEATALAGPSGLIGAGSGAGSGFNTSGLQGAALIGGAAALGVGGLAAALGRGSGKAPGTPGATGAAAAAPGSRPGGAVTDGVLGREGDRSAASGVRTSAGNRANSAAAGGRGTGDDGDEDEDEHDTWLTEDDMDWGAEDAPPSVLGGRSGDESSGAPAPDESQGARAQPAIVDAAH